MNNDETLWEFSLANHSSENNWWCMRSTGDCHLLPEITPSIYVREISFGPRPTPGSRCNLIHTTSRKFCISKTLGWFSWLKSEFDPLWRLELVVKRGQIFEYGTLWIWPRQSSTKTCLLANDDWRYQTVEFRSVCSAWSSHAHYLTLRQIPPNLLLRFYRR